MDSNDISASEREADCFKYIVDSDGGAVLIGYTGVMERVVIPSQIEGHPVTRLEGTFRSFELHEIQGFNMQAA